MQFRERVIKIIKSIPKGKVASYGQVASIAGSPGAARQVGFILHSSELYSLPWWRVINNAGRISIKGSFEATKVLQKQLLEREDIVVTNSFSLNIEKYRYKPSKSELARYHKIQKGSNTY